MLKAAYIQDSEGLYIENTGIFHKQVTNFSKASRGIIHKLLNLKHWTSKLDSSTQRIS